MKCVTLFLLLCAVFAFNEAHSDVRIGNILKSIDQTKQSLLQTTEVLKNSEKLESFEEYMSSLNQHPKIGNVNAKMEEFVEKNNARFAKILRANNGQVPEKSKEIQSSAENFAREKEEIILNMCWKFHAPKKFMQEGSMMTRKRINELIDSLETMKVQAEQQCAKNNLTDTEVDRCLGEIESNVDRINNLEIPPIKQIASRLLQHLVDIDDTKLRCMDTVLNMTEQWGNFESKAETTEEEFKRCLEENPITSKS